MQFLQYVLISVAPPGPLSFQTVLSRPGPMRVRSELVRWAQLPNCRHHVAATRKHCTGRRNQITGCTLIPCNVKELFEKIEDQLEQQKTEHMRLQVLVPVSKAAVQAQHSSNTLGSLVFAELLSATSNSALTRQWQTVLRRSSVHTEGGCPLFQITVEVAGYGPISCATKLQHSS